MRTRPREAAAGVWGVGFAGRRDATACPAHWGDGDRALRIATKKRGVKKHDHQDFELDGEADGVRARLHVTRCRSLDLSDSDIDGGEQRDVTVGINRRPITNLRFSASYTKVLDVDGGPHPDDEPSAFSVRSQIEL